MTTVALFGNCQIHGIAQCFRAMSRSLIVKEHSFRALRTNDQPAASPAADVVLLQHRGERTPTDLEVSLRASGAQVVCFPTIYFPAFHPDFVYARSVAAAKTLGSPIGNMSSAICVFAWQTDSGSERGNGAL